MYGMIPGLCGRWFLMSGYVPDSASLEPGWMFIRNPMDSD